MLLTSLPSAAWSATEVLRLYQARWQMEVRFKRMQQVLRLNTIRHRGVPNIQPTISALLIAWVFHEEEVVEIRPGRAHLSQVLHAPAARPHATGTRSS